MNPLKRITPTPDIIKCIIGLWNRNMFNKLPITIVINPTIRNPDIKLKSFFEKTTYIVKPPKVIAVSAKAWVAILGPTA